jgi:Protein of unknown function (DUF1573)
MQKVFFIVYMLVSLGHILAQDTTGLNKEAGPLLKFESGNVKEYGQIQRGSVITDTFWFENSGNLPLIIANVTPSCGCTSVAWTKFPVQPNQKGYVSFELNTRKEDFGKFNKELFIQSNAVNATKRNGRYVLQVKGVVKRRVKGRDR